MSRINVLRLTWIQVGFALILWLLTLVLHLLAGMPATDPGRPSGPIELVYVALRSSTFLGMAALGGLIAAPPAMPSDGSTAARATLPHSS